jgi:hypothetical protein
MVCCFYVLAYTFLNPLMEDKPFDFSLKHTLINLTIWSIGGILVSLWQRWAEKDREKRRAEDDFRLEN